jgi:hypothetical protein
MKMMRAVQCVRKVCIVMILKGQMASINDKKLPCGESELALFSLFYLVVDTMSCFELF